MNHSSLLRLMVGWIVLNILAGGSFVLSADSLRAVAPVPSTTAITATRVAPLNVTYTVKTFAVPSRTATAQKPILAPYPGPQPAPPIAPTRTPTRQGEKRGDGSRSVFLPFISTDASSALNSGVGIERYWTFHTFSLSDRITLHLNVWNGNVVVQYTALALPSRGLPLDLLFTYNSQTNAWTHTLNVALTLDATGAAIVRDADGTEHLFRREANGIYTAPAGNYDTLVRNADQTFTLTHPDQSAHLFDASGRLTQVRDRNGNAINLTYTNNVLTHAQAAGGQTLTFAYSGGNLASVTDHAGRAFQFGYTSGALTSITDPLNFVTRFGYTNNRLTTLTDARNIQTTIAYDTSQRAQTITTAGVRLANLAYSAGTTTFTDANNNATVYTLNATGQVTQIRDALGGLTTFTYDANYNIT